MKAANTAEKSVETHHQWFVWQNPGMQDILFVEKANVPALTHHFCPALVCWDLGPYISESSYMHTGACGW